MSDFHWCLQFAAEGDPPVFKSLYLPCYPHRVDSSGAIEFKFREYDLHQEVPPTFTKSGQKIGLTMSLTDLREFDAPLLTSRGLWSLSSLVNGDSLNITLRFGPNQLDIECEKYHESNFGGLSYKPKTLLVSNGPLLMNEISMDLAWISQKMKRDEQIALEQMIANLKRMCINTNNNDIKNLDVIVEDAIKAVKLVQTAIKDSMSG